MDGEMGITAAINQLCVLDNLIHFSSVLPAWHAQNRSVGTKFAINLSRPLPTQPHHLLRAF
jgi:hypothetical protein